MNKGQGLTLGAVLAASLMLKPGTSSPSHATEIGAGTVETKENSLLGVSAQRQKGPSREGPWLASCRYWAPVQEVGAKEQEQDAAKDATPEIRGDLQMKKRGLNIYLDMKAMERDWGCGGAEGERWGLPRTLQVAPETKDAKKGKKAKKALDPYAPHITAVIATVPDPVHTHLALSFDRAIVAMLEAASENNYVSSYYWLPWSRHGADVHGADNVGELEAGHDPEREQEPGLIVLKYAPINPKTSKDPSESFYKVIYLFLVAETPTQGVDGLQLSHAFKYEHELAGLLNDKGAPCGITPAPLIPASKSVFLYGFDSCDVSIVGPLFTGSAASLRVGLEAAHSRDLRLNTFDVRGGTTSPLAVEQLSTGPKPQPSLNPGKQPVQPAKGMRPTLAINYHSFDVNGDYTSLNFLYRTFKSGGLVAGTNYPRVGKLTEDNSTLGVSGSNRTLEVSGSLQIKLGDITKTAEICKVQPPSSNEYLCNVIDEFHFPREISLLRNAEIESGSAGAGSDATPSPYLRLSAKDTGNQDELPQFAHDNTPLSQEAELMALARQLKQNQVRYLLFGVPSNPLDQIFLARFLHRSNPNTRLVFMDPDLMMVREVDSASFFGSITVTPFPMNEIEDRAYSDSVGITYYNAASMTFWKKDEIPRISDSLDSSYRDSVSGGSDYQPSLWATVIGTDGYYLLGQLNPCASDNDHILPAIDKSGNLNERDCRPHPGKLGHGDDKPYPVSRLWIGLAFFVDLLCVVHSVMLLKARYWSTLTRHLAIMENDEQVSRAIYVQIGGSVLFLMAFTVAAPVIALHTMSKTNMTDFMGANLLAMLGLLTVGLSMWKSWPGLWQERVVDKRRFTKRGLLVYALVCVEAVGIAGAWSYLCLSNTPTIMPAYRGLAFSYRCVHPESGVSPIVPVFLLLFSWHLWSLLQASRLRFSKLGKPTVPHEIPGQRTGFFVAEEQLRKKNSEGTRSLYENLWETFVAERFFGWLGDRPRLVKFLAFLLTVGAPSMLCLFSLFDGVDHFMWDTGKWRSSPYEAVVGLLFYPLFAMAVAGWGRMLLVWSSLRRDLLDRLENQPIRFAFNRLKGMGWIALLQQGAVYEHWRDMARSIESIRQILHQDEMQHKHKWLSERLRLVEARILELVEELRPRVDGPKPAPWQPSSPDLVAELETKFGEYGQDLLEGLLVPYWRTERIGLVESEFVEPMPVRARRRSETQSEGADLSMDVYAEPEPERKLIVAAEEYVALRYIALIRAVLTSVRAVMAFISTFFVLAIVAWNSYPFQPRELVDWLTTCVLMVIGAGMVWVFAQMHRNPILSRTTDTKSNELGWDFYLRIVSFGAIPLLTWLAYAFPSVGGTLYRLVQPGVEILK